MMRRGLGVVLVLSVLAAWAARADAATLRLTAGTTVQVLDASEKRTAVSLNVASGEAAQCGTTEQLQNAVTVNSSVITFNFPTSAVWCRSAAGAVLTYTIAASTPVNVIDARVYKIVGDGTTDDSGSMQAALDACGAAGGSVIELPPGTFRLASALQLKSNSNCTIRGAGDLTILDGSPTSSAVIGTSGQFANNLRFERLTIRPGSVAAFNVNGRQVGRMNFDNVTFDLRAGGYGFFGQGMAGTTFERCTFYDDGNGSASRGIQFQRGSRDVIVRNSAFRFLYQGFIFDAGTSGEEPSEGVTITGNIFDGGWWVRTTAFSGSGANVSYTGTTVTDTGASLSGVAADTTVRALPVRASGTVTSIAVSGTELVDAAADFVTAAVSRGDLVRSGSVFATVIAVKDADELWVDEWRDQTTMQLAAPPTTSAAYTIYRLLLGKVSSTTATVVTLRDGGWVDWTGASVTPSAQTLYEILTTHPDYGGVQIEKGVSRIIITNNQFRRSWSDQISVFGDDATVANNVVTDGQDFGITLNGSNHTLADNRVEHQGVGGIYVGCSDSVVTGNVVTDTTWSPQLLSVYTTAAGISVRGGDRNTLTSNTVDDGVSSRGIYNIFVDLLSADNATGNVLASNRSIGAATAGLRLNSAGADATVVNLNTFDSISIVTTTNTVMNGAATYTNATLPTVANGSSVYCSDCLFQSSCAGGGTGAFAKRLNGAWRCD